MFKARWRSEKKIKALFILQFQATQVPQLKRKRLMISLVPADTGKPTVRLEKTAILDGTCSWKNPIYETVKLIREPKTGTIKEKIYYFVVSTGSSKSGFLGEVSLDFADFAETVEPLMVSMPLEHSNSGAILHVTIQKLQGTHDLREFSGDIEEDEAPMAESLDRKLGNQLSNCINYDNSNLNFTEDTCSNNITSQLTKQNGSFSYPPLDNTTNPRDQATLRGSSLPQTRTVDVIPTEKQMHQRFKREQTVGSASDGSIADSTTSKNFMRNWSLEASNHSIESLKNEISILERQAEVSELELHSLRKQIVKENTRGYDLSRQISGLKEERDALVTECEQLKSSQNCVDEVEVPKQLQSETENLRVLLEETMKELKHEKNLNNTQRLQLQKTEDSNSELIFAVRDLEEMLERKGKEISLLNSKTKASQNAKEALDGEIDVLRKDKEELKMHMEQLDLDYENWKQKNNIEHLKMQNEHSESLTTIELLKLQVERLETEIIKQALEFSESSNKISELKTKVESLEKEMEKQAQDFEDDLQAMTEAKVEQEQRAIQAEEALRKTRQNNANATESLQEEFRRLSVEMATKVDENENLAMKTVAEANDLRVQKRVLEEVLQTANVELRLMKDNYDEKLQDLYNQINQQVKQIKQISLELEDNHKDEIFKQHREKNNEAFSIEIETQKGEIRQLKMEKKGHSEGTEQKETLRDDTGEKAPLEREFASLRKEVKKFWEEPITYITLKEEDKDTIVGVLQSEIKKLRSWYNEMKYCLHETDLENQHLRKQVFKLEGDLKKKEAAITSIENELKNNSEHCTHSEIGQLPSKDCITPLPFSANVVNLAHKLRSLQEQVGLKEAALENSATYPEARSAEEASTNTSKLEDTRDIVEHLCEKEMNTREGRSNPNGFGTGALEREIVTCRVKEHKVSTCHASDEGDLTQLSIEAVSLKERNRQMECELKEMHEKYSEISLKFAEVEGERQQLVMIVRSLKNGKKK